MGNFKETYAAQKAIKDRERARDRIDDDKREKEDQAKIMAYLNSIGATKFWTNGYTYHFDYLDKYWSFVNQTTRICGQCHRFLADDEKEMVHDLLTMEHRDPEMYQAGCEEFDYRHFVINGDPLDALRKAINVNRQPEQKLLPAPNITEETKNEP